MTFSLRFACPGRGAAFFTVHRRAGTDMWTPDQGVGWAKALFAPCPPSIVELSSEMVGTRSLSSGAHSRDPLALPTLRFSLNLRRADLGQKSINRPAQHAGLIVEFTRV